MYRLAALSFLLTLGCSTSPCQHLASSINNATGSCTATVSVNVNQCNLACSTIDQTALDQAASCLEAVPACTASNEATFTTAVANCDNDLKNVTSECLVAVTQPAVTSNTDGGQNGPPQHNGQFDCSAAVCGKAPSAMSVSQCEAALNGACGSQFNAFALCAEGNSTCNADGGTSSGNINSACSSQISAVVTCCQSHSTDPGCQSINAP